MNHKVKYGLLRYETENIGDEIQSLAACRFLPTVDYYFDRDNIDATKVRAGEKVKLIMNGWYTHHPENWPPKNPAINPLLIAIHIEQDALDGRVKKAFLSNSSRDFLKKHGPVGARNLPTEDLLTREGVKNYFSGCLTLTLLPDKSIKKRDYILAVDISDKLFEALKERTSRKIIRLDAYRTRNLSAVQKMTLAKYWLSLYQSAHAVVTTRLHCMLPCLALGTPVLAISGNDLKRFAGLIELTNHTLEEEFLNETYSYDLDNPPKNPDDFRELAEKLVKKVRDFTEYDSQESFLDGESLEDFYASPEFIDLIGSLSREACRGEVAMMQLSQKRQSSGAKSVLKTVVHAIRKK